MKGLLIFANTLNVVVGLYMILIAMGHVNSTDNKKCIMGNVLAFVWLVVMLLILFIINGGILWHIV